MDIRHLRCFMAVSEFLNFTKAAHQLCLTQSAVSYQIAPWSGSLGSSSSTGRPIPCISPRKGLHFYNGLKGVMASYEDLVASSRRMASGLTQSLEVGFLGGVEKRLLPPLVKRMREREPLLSLRINRFDLVPLSVALEKGEVDVAFTLAIALPAIPGIQSRLLFRERLVVIMAPDHPLAHRENLAFEDLREQRFLDLEHPLNAPANDLLVDICTRRGFAPRIVERFHDLDSLVMAVESGVGIGVFPKYRGDENLGPRLTYVPLAGSESTSDYVVAWRKGNTNPALPAFLRELGVRA